MSVFVLALNPGRRILFRWKCNNVVEARGIVRNMYTIFGHCLNVSTPTDRINDDVLFRKCTYDKVVQFTYETHPSYYMLRV